MNQKNNTFSVKKQGFSLVIALFLLVGLLLAVSFALLQIEHYETYYTTAVWITTILFSFFLALIHRIVKGLSEIYAVLSACLISAGAWIFGLILMGKDYPWGTCLVRFGALIVFTVAFLFLFERVSSKKKRVNPKFKFMK